MKEIRRRLLSRGTDINCQRTALILNLSIFTSNLLYFRTYTLVRSDQWKVLWTIRCIRFFHVNSYMGTASFANSGMKSVAIAFVMLMKDTTYLFFFCSVAALTVQTLLRSGGTPFSAWASPEKFTHFWVSLNFFASKVGSQGSAYSNPLVNTILCSSLFLP